jgi:hypothetical protein
MNKGKVTREPDGIMTNAERNKKVTTNTRLEFIAWITEEELEALETDEETSKLETIIKLYRQPEEKSNDERKNSDETSHADEITKGTTQNYRSETATRKEDKLVHQPGSSQQTYS